MKEQFNLNNQIAKTLERERLKEVWIEFMQQLSGDVWRLQRPRPRCYDHGTIV